MGSGTGRTICALALLSLACACRGDLSIVQPASRNAAPLADAGTGSTYLVTSTITLDASGSFDPDGQIVAYRWQLFSAPGTSGSAIANPTAMTTSFVLDRPGTYVFDLTVTDDGGDTDTSRVTFVAAAPQITIDAGADQSVPWLATVQLSGSYQIEAGFPGNPHWSFVSRPLKSTAAITGADTLTPTFVADAEGVYVVQFSVQNYYAGTVSATVMITATASHDVLGYAVIDAEYAPAIDRLIAVSDAPPTLHIHDPATGLESAVPLSAIPNAVSVEPGGTRAVVAHNHLVTLVDLVAANVVATYTPGLDIADIVFGTDGHVHCTPQGFGTFTPMYTVTLSTAAVTQDPDVWGNTRARLHPGGQRMYTPDDYESPSRMSRWDVTKDPFVLASEWSYFGQHGTGYDLWFLQGGAWFVTTNGEVFSSTDATSTDMVYRTKLAIPSGAEVSWSDDATALGKLAAAITLDPYGTTTDAALMLFDDQTLASLASIPMPDTPYGGSSYHSKAKLTAFRSDGSKLYVLTNAAVSGSLTVSTIYTIQP